MPRNVEVKAKIKNFNKVIGIAKNLCLIDAEVLNQEDIFFKTSVGRLKLRNIQDESKGQLIYYNRPDIEGPKISDYSISLIENYKELSNILKQALGVVGIVKKTRHLFFYEQTRIHIDRVEGLGDFIELEVVLTPEQTHDDGEKIINFLMSKLEICKEDLVSEAYLNLLQEKHNQL